jgi:hypothetical protein
MTTFSFDYQLAATESDEVLDPTSTYTITLHGDAGMPTRFEMNTLLDETPSALVKLRFATRPQHEKFLIDRKVGHFDHLRSEHYTWHVARNDGKPMQTHEVQYAFFTQAMGRPEEPVFSIPHSTLQVLLTGAEPLIQALTSALRNAQIGQADVNIPDPQIAAGLIELGLITPSAARDVYALMDIAVIG